MVWAGLRAELVAHLKWQIALMVKKVLQDIWSSIQQRSIRCVTQNKSFETFETLKVLYFISSYSTYWCMACNSVTIKMFFFYFITVYDYSRFKDKYQNSCTAEDRQNCVTSLINLQSVNFWAQLIQTTVLHIHSDNSFHYKRCHCTGPKIGLLGYK